MEISSRTLAAIFILGLGILLTIGYFVLTSENIENFNRL